VIWDGINDGIGEGDREDGEGDGGEDAHNRGERINSLSSSGPRSRSSSLRRFLVLLAGGVVTSGGEGGATAVSDSMAWEMALMILHQLG
jgi:hypothetical protein